MRALSDRKYMCIQDNSCTNEKDIE